MLTENYYTLEEKDLNGKHMNTTIYIKLLDEGSDAYRPVIAEKIDKNIYKISDGNSYDSEDETWEFIPGTIVWVERKKLSNENLLVAIRKY